MLGGNSLLMATMRGSLNCWTSSTREIHVSEKLISLTLHRDGNGVGRRSGHIPRPRFRPHSHFRPPFLPRSSLWGKNFPPSLSPAEI